MQELMLLHSLSRSETDTLFNQFQFDIEGDFAPDEFQIAWQAIVDRHAALRTAFIWQDVKQPLQVVRKSVAVQFRVDDLRDEEVATQNDGIEEYLRVDRRAGFELQRAPLMRFCLFRLTDEKWRFIWSSHHLIVDRWCLGQIYSELDQNYACAVTSGRVDRLPDTPGFKAYIDWLSSQDKTITLAYWADTLSGYRGSGQLLPQNSDSAAYPPGRTASSEIEIDVSVADALEKFTKNNALTPGIVVQAAWSLALNRLLVSQDVVFGLTVSGRPAEIPGVESIVGSFINNVPVRVRFSESMRVTRWLQNMQAEQFARARHEYLSGAQLKKGLADRQVDTEFESLLVWLAGVGGTNNLDMRQVSASYATAYPLTMSVLQTKDGLRVRADAASRHKEKLGEILQVFSDALQALLRAKTDTKIGDLPAFSAQAGFSESDIGERAVELRDRLPHFDGKTPVADVARGREKLRTDVLRELVEAEWVNVLGTPRLDMGQDFFAAGGTSLRAAALHSRLEVATRQSIPLLALFHRPTIKGMVATIFDEDWPVRSDRVSCIRPGSDRAPLFCVASPEVNTVGYVFLARYLNDDQGIYALQSPPGDNRLRQVHPDELPELAIQYVESMKRVQPRGPYRMLAMCTGSHIALEMARQLEAENDRVSFLGIINTWSMYSVSRLYHINRLINQAHWYSRRIRGLVPFPTFRGTAGAATEQTAISSQTDVIAAESLKGAGNAWIYDVGFSADNPKLPRLTSPVSVFRLKRQPFWRIRDESLGWSLHAKDVKVVRIAGKDHEYMLREPYISELAAGITNRLGNVNDEPHG
jgi:thioesterase domain-containing protein